MNRCSPVRVIAPGSLLLGVALLPWLAAAQEGTLVMPHSDDQPPPTAAPQLTKQPSIVKSVDALYPPEAKAQGLSGDVALEITLAADGTITDLKVAEPGGHGFDEAAVAAARAMTFDPPVRCGKVVSSTFKIGFSFAPSPT